MEEGDGCIVTAAASGDLKKKTETDWMHSKQPGFDSASIGIWRLPRIWRSAGSNCQFTVSVMIGDVFDIGLKAGCKIRSRIMVQWSLMDLFIDRMQLKGVKKV
jgi:hypothetical protein